MDGDIKWLIGMSVTLIVAFGSALIASFRATTKSIKEGDDQLHERINRTRDDYVRRADLDGHLRRIDDNVKEMRDENREGTRETNRRLDALLTAFPAASTPPQKRNRSQ